MTSRFMRVLAVQFTFGFSFSVYFLIPKYLATVFGADGSVIGTVSAAPLASGVIASPFIGRALDRTGRRPLLLAGAAIVLLTSLGMTTVTSVGVWLYALRLLQGIGIALVFNAAAAMVTDVAPAERLGHAMGLLGAAALVTNAAGPAAAELVAAHWGWNPVFYGAAAMAGVSLVLGLNLHDSATRPPAELPRAPNSGVRPLFLVGAVTGAAFATLITFTQPFALEQGAQRVAGFFVGYTVAALFVRLTLGNLGDRVGRMPVAIVSLAAYGVVTLATAFLRPGLLELFGLAFGAAHGLLYPSLAALVAEKSERSRRGSALTAFNAAFNAGSGLTLLGCGPIAEAWGYPAVFALTGSLTLLAVAVLVAASPRLHRPSQRLP